ncbi:MAG: spermidine synthase [Caulobacterales bacterium]
MNRLLDRRGFGLALAGLLAGPPLAATAQGLSWGPQILEQSKSPFNDIIVMRDGQDVALVFRVGRCEFVESIYRPSDPEFLPVEYTRFATAALLYPGKLGRFLEIGLGGGRTVSYLRRFVPEMAITTVEIDPGVVAAAKKHFGVKEDERLKIIVDDGRRYVMNSQEQYDIAFIDAFRGTWVPHTLTTVEFFKAVKARLNPGGVVAQNVEPTTLFYDGMAATLRAVWKNVDAFASGQDSEQINTVLVAYDGPRLSDRQIAQRAEALQARYKFRHDLRPIAKVRRIEKATGAAPLRDGFDQSNVLLMIDRSNSNDAAKRAKAATPRQRRAQCE